MANQGWMFALDGSSVLLADVLDACRAVIGAAHRRSLEGEDAAQDRRYACETLLALLPTIRAELAPLAAALDWWLVAALGERQRAETAWQIKRQIPGATGEALERVLTLKVERPLEVFRYPARLAEILKRLKDLTSQHGKIAQDGRILKQANQECAAVLHAAQHGAPRPPGLRLAGISAEEVAAWASEEEEGRGLIVGSPLWGVVVRGLTERAELIDEAFSIWKDTHIPRIELPKEWEQELRAVTDPHHDVALALVADLLPNPPSRPLLAVDLARYAEAPPRARWRVYRLAREAYGAAGQEPTAWMRACKAEIEELRDAVDVLRDQARGAMATCAEYVEAAAQSLERGDIDETRDWVEEAREAIRKASRDTATERRQAALQQQREELEGSGEPLPALTGEIERDEQDLQVALTAARRRIHQRIDALAALLEALSRRAAPDPDLQHARADADRLHLRAANAAIARAEARAATARAEDDARLGPDLAALRDQIAPRPDRLVLLGLLDLAATRRGAGLDPEPPLQDLDMLLGRPAPAALEERPGWGWLLGEDEDLPLVPERTRLYVIQGGNVFGPCVARGARCVPEHGWIAVASLPAPTFFAVAGRVESAGGVRVPYPPSLEELRSVGAELEDAFSDEELAEWIAVELEGAPPIEPLRRWIGAVRGDGVPPELYEARMRRLQDVLPRAERLEPFRAHAVQAYLDTEEGKAGIDAATQRIAAREEDRLRGEIEARRAELSDGIAALEARRAALEAEQARLQEEAQARLARLQAEIGDADALLEDRRLTLLARFMHGGPPGSGASGGAPWGAGQAQAILHGPPVASAPLRAVAAAYRSPPPISEIVSLVADKTWDAQDVANLLLSVLTGRWTLLAGLPGVGKSTFVRSVLSRIGHGPGSGRYLELVVRRDWQDDTPLFGFWHPTHHAWEPSSEGFVEHLLRAADDHAAGYGGLYPVLIEELNLASPEYYLARPISALEAAQPLVRLYDPALTPQNAERYPASFAIPDAVRLLATVNVDDTVERLSPRFLSRASVLRVEPGRGLSWRPDGDAPRIPLSWSSLAAAVDGPPGELGPIERLIRFLTERRVPGGPTARTRVAMERYLGAAQGVLDRQRAEDLLILQRVLPPLRGVGTPWRKLLDDLITLLTEQRWPLSAARARDLRERGEALGDWYDFFHT